ncbi:MAG TPA: formimidoylglutamate deiminase [Burkholderiaceae bacterium]|nr:formimidoylglutamate deiminase [Burkholderiaceae bacterium]
MPRPVTFWTPRAWIGGAWHAQVLLACDAAGRWSDIRAGVAAPQDGERLDGAVIPPLVDAHSHAFQRAMAGLAERRATGDDDFWSWRDRMYRVALRITPDQLRAIAAQLYVEVLRGGYTQACEFHYLQHDIDGSRYADPMALSWALADAADEAGIGLTLLPVLYERAGFTQGALREDQRRFATTPADVIALHRAAQRSGRRHLNAGVAIHSLRAAPAQSIHTLKRLARDIDGPIHIHVAEQTAEVDDCLAATGARPIEWLLRERLLDARWQLVHATHATASEIEGVAASGAGIVICPTTEANLGDGLPDLPRWLACGVPLAIGSDSQITRGWAEELRWLDYGQRLALRRRNVAAQPGAQPATAARLYDAALAAGAASAGLGKWGLEIGARADFLVLDAQDQSLLGVPPPHTLDALVFSSPGDAIRDVAVAGEFVIRDRRHTGQDAIAARFEQAMTALWPG